MSMLFHFFPLDLTDTCSFFSIPNVIELLNWNVFCKASPAMFLNDFMDESGKSERHYGK